MDEELQQLEELKNKLILYFVENGMRLLIAVLILVLGFWVGKKIANLILNICNKKGLDPTLARFFASFTKVVIIIFALIMSLSKANIEVTPFIALLGASAFGLSLAVQGPISNYGAGVVLIITRPFVVGDTLTLNGLCGTVDSVNLGNTQLINEDEERITIPNRKVLGEIFTNSYEYKIVEAVVGIDYGADPQNAIDCITAAVKTIDGIAPNRDPDVGIEDFGDSSINIGYRVWVPTNAYHRTRYQINMAVFRALEEAKINIPFPQRDVHLIQKES
ncbi:MAG: mechanosensitive ion channel family protein [Opitutaceae bacterium]